MQYSYSQNTVLAITYILPHTHTHTQTARDIYIYTRTFYLALS